jgi:hypothetical protein
MPRLCLQNDKASAVVSAAGVVSVDRRFHWINRQVVRQRGSFGSMCVSANVITREGSPFIASHNVSIPLVELGRTPISVAESPQGEPERAPRREKDQKSAYSSADGGGSTTISLTASRRSRGLVIYPVEFVRDALTVEPQDALDDGSVLRAQP